LAPAAGPGPRAGRGSSGPALGRTGGLPARTDLLPSFDWRPFDPAIEAEFRAVLQATYVGTMDMPELEGARGLGDILDGHRTAGLFVPGRWQLGRIPGEPAAAAVLLMTEVADRDAWEV